MSDKVIVTFCDHMRQTAQDLEIDIDVTAHDFILAVSQAFSLGLDPNDLGQCYLACENPIALLRGVKTLREFGVRNGSAIHFKR